MSFQQYSLVTLNVNGLQNPVKKGKLFAKMKKEGHHIIFWQETHLTKKGHEKRKYPGFKNIFYSSNTKGPNRGVAILISNKISFQFSSQIADKEGRYILIKGILDSKVVTLLNIYRPLGQDKSLIRTIFDLIVTETSGVLICGGDWNVQLHPTLDSSNLLKKQNPESLYVRKMLNEVGLIDLWRELHLSSKAYTFFSHPHGVYSRIDYFFLCANQKDQG